MSIHQMFLGFPPPSSGAAPAIETNGLIAYWDAIPANVSGEYVSDTSGNGWSSVEAKWSGASNNYNANRNGGAFECPFKSTAYNYFDLGDPIVFGTGGSNNQGTEFTFFIGIKYPNGVADSYAMFFTGQDQNNFIGQSTGGGWRIDSNQDLKADASGTDIGTGLNVIHVTMDSTGYVKWYLNGSFNADCYYRGQSGQWNGDNIIINSMNSYPPPGANMSYGSQHYWYFSGVYNRVLTATEIASNTAIHNTRLGI